MPSPTDPCLSENEALALVCGKLKSEDLARLLAHTERCGSCALIVAEAGRALVELDGDAPSHASARSVGVFAPGQLVASRYLIERRVGRGGMGEVYAALDQEFNDRVALKTISPAFASDPSIVSRFKQELRLARRISHPSVCRVFEFGRHEPPGGPSQCFFTLQFIEGVTLRRRLLDSGSLPLGEALTLAETLARGLAAIHEQNVVHRDIKPENVMLPPQQGSAAAIWVDFGLARVDLRDTVSAGVLAGTPDYSAPELLRGAVASRSSDLYGFGVMLYELLTGVLPFARSTSFSAASERQSLAPPPPSAQRGEIPPALDALVLECLQEAPERRPASAGHVADRLRDLTNAPRSAPDPVAPRAAAKAPSTPVVGAPGRAVTRWRLPVSIALAATAAASGATWALSPGPAELASPSVVATATLAPAPSLASTPPAPSAGAAGPARPRPQRSAAPSRTAPVPPNSPVPAASQATPPVPDFGGRR